MLPSTLMMTYSKAITLPSLAVLAGTPNTNTPGATTSPSITFVNSAACVMVLQIQTWGLGGYPGVKSVTDSAGHTWNRRKRTLFNSANYQVGSVDSLNQEVWWANVTAAHASAVTVTATLAGSGFIATGSHLAIFGVTGSASPAAPWDGDSPTVANYSHASTATIPTVSYTAAAAEGDMALSFLAEMTASGVNGSSLGGLMTAPYTAIQSGATAHYFTAAEYKLSAAGTATMAWGSSALAWLNYADGLTGAASGSANDVTAPATSPVLSQTTATSNGASTTFNAPVTSNSGEYILVCLHRCFQTAGASSTVTSITDARGNTYTLKGRQQLDALSHQTSEVWGARNDGASGTFNLSITWGAAGDSGSAITSSWSNVDTAKPVTTPVFQVNDSDTGILATVNVTNPAAHSQCIEFGASTEDTSFVTLAPTSPSGYGSFSALTTNNAGTGTTRSSVGVNAADTVTTKGAATIATGSGAQVVRRFIYSAFFLRGQ